MSHARSLLPCLWCATVMLCLGTMSRADSPPDQYALYNGYDETIVDSFTKLTWTRHTIGARTTRKDAAPLCAALTLAGATYRLPTLRELSTLVDEVGQVEVVDGKVVTKWIDVSAFPGAATGAPYWTSSSHPSLAKPSPYGIDFGTGLSAVYGETELGYVRCVSAP